MSKRVAIIGTNAFGKHLFHLIVQYTDDIVIGWYDDFANQNQQIENVNVLGKIEDINPENFDYLAIAIGYNHLEFKLKLIHQLKAKGISLYNFIHPNSVIDTSTKFGEGIIIFPNSVIGKNVSLEDGVVVHNSVTISHDCKIGECTFICPSVSLAGNVNLGKKCFIGIGSIFTDNVSIVNESTIGAGTLVHHSIENPGTYVNKRIQTLTKLK